MDKGQSVCDSILLKNIFTVETKKIHHKNNYDYDYPREKPCIYFFSVINKFPQNTHTHQERHKMKYETKNRKKMKRKCHRIVATNDKMGGWMNEWG